MNLISISKRSQGLYRSISNVIILLCFRTVRRIRGLTNSNILFNDIGVRPNDSLPITNTQTKGDKVLATYTSNIRMHDNWEEIQMADRQSINQLSKICPWSLSDHQMILVYGQISSNPGRNYWLFHIRHGESGLYTPDRILDPSPSALFFFQITFIM